MWDPFAEFELLTMPNGLKIYVAHWPEKSWETMGFLIHSGAENDPVGSEGLAHFVEHLVSVNGICSQKDIQRFFDECGGRVDFGSTNFSYTQYRFSVPADRIFLDPALSMFGSMLLSANLDDFIEREKEVIIGEIHKRYPFRIKFDLEMRERKALYGQHWLGRFVRPFGDTQSVGRIQRDDLQSFYDAHYTPANMSVVCVGGMNAVELWDVFDGSPFSMDKKGERTPMPERIKSFDPPSENRHIFEISQYVSSPIEVGSYRTVARIPGNLDENAVRIMDMMFSRWLHEEVRERRALTYNIDSNRINYRQFHQFSIDCPAVALRGMGEIEEIIEQCIVSMADREDLFEQAKARILARSRIIDLTGREVCEEALEDLAYGYQIDSVTETMGEISRTRMDSVRSILKWLRPELRWTLISRP